MIVFVIVKSRMKRIHRNFIDRLGSWARKWGMRFQPVKCNMMQLTNKRSNKIQTDTFDVLLPCVSSDYSIVNQSGRWLIDRCVDNQLYVLNGRTLGDLTGQFTCHTHRGSSTVDYILASRSLSNYVHSMTVHGLGMFSDHCILEAKLKLGSCLSFDDNDCLCDTKGKDFAPDNFKWNERSKDKFQESFSSHLIRTKLTKCKILMKITSVTLIN